MGKGWTISWNCMGNEKRDGGGLGGLEVGAGRGRDWDR